MGADFRRKHASFIAVAVVEPDVRQAPPFHKTSVVAAIDVGTARTVCGNIARIARRSALGA